MDTLSYYATQSPFTDPGDYSSQLSELPKTVPELCGAIQGLCLDYAERYKYPIVNERLLVTNSRYVSKIIKEIFALNKAPLTEKREERDRFLASTSDFASLLCAALRLNGVPARKRVGFRTEEDGYRSLELVEYWDGNGWQQADPSGLLTGDFVPAAQAWQMCRSGQADPEKFFDEESRGLVVVRANLILDLANMTKRELLNWDRYGWMNRPFEDFSDRAWEILDTLAELLAAGDEKLEEMQALYEREEGIQVPRVIWCASPVVPPHKAELTF